VESAGARSNNTMMERITSSVTSVIILEGLEVTPCMTRAEYVVTINNKGEVSRGTVGATFIH